MNDSHQQPLAYMLPEFLQSPDARPLRIIAEYLEPLRRIRKNNIQDTVVFFGSARILSREGAEGELKKASECITKSVGDTEQAALKRALKAAEWSRYYEDARTLAGMVTKWSQSLKSPRKRFVVCSGGGPGIMEAANRGATEAGGPTLGFNIRLPEEQGANPYIPDDLHFEFHYFFMRKFWFAYLAKAMVVFPGGFGTIDEMFEILTLVQTRKLDRTPQIILYGPEYWDPILQLQHMADWGAIAEEDLSLFTRASTPQQAFDLLQKGLEKYLAPPPTAAAVDIAQTRN